jgi:branched-chain amino acid transport system substrate-binding protein
MKPLAPNTAKRAISGARGASDLSSGPSIEGARRDVKRLAGREINVTVEDDESKAATGLAKAKVLVEGQGVQLLMGPVSAPVGYALAPYIEEKRIPALLPVVAGDDLTQRKRTRYAVRTGWSSSQPSHPFGKWVHDTLKYKRIAMIAGDTAFGWEVLGGFQRSFEEAGGQVVQKLWAPLPTPAFAPYVAKLRRDVDAVFVQFAGEDAINFAKAYAEAGLKDKLPLIGSGTFTDEGVLRSMGDEALGVVTVLHYSAVAPTAANRKFAQAYEAKYRQMPSYYAEGATWPASRSRPGWRRWAATSRTPRSSWPPSAR